MNLAFWGEARQSDTTAHMMAVAGMLRALCGEKRVVTGGFLRGDTEKFACCDCGAGKKRKHRHFLWHADLAVINLRQCDMDYFFAEDFHIAKNMMFLVGGGRETDAALARLRYVWRAEPERAAWIPYNSAFYQALSKGKSDAFIAREFRVPSNLANEEFLCRIQTATLQILRAGGYETERSCLRGNEIWNRL